MATVLALCLVPGGCSKTTVVEEGPVWETRLDAPQTDLGSPGTDAPGIDAEMPHGDAAPGDTGSNNDAGLMDLPDLQPETVPPKPEIVVELPSAECGNGFCNAALQENCSTCPLDCPCQPGSVCGGSSCCWPTCEGMDCGEDGCGGTCGSCFSIQQCVAGECVVDCQDECDEPDSKGCKDGAIVTCGDFNADACLDWGDQEPCPPGHKCSDAKCICVPQCDGKECGASGCNGVCGSCILGTDCVNGKCIEGGCQDECAKGQTSCVGNNVVLCGQFDADECLDWGDSQPCPEDEMCMDGGCGCTPNCLEKECGEDGCGGTCGKCTDCFSCTDYACKPGAFVLAGTDCPPGFTKGGAWHTGPGAPDGMDEGCGYEQQCTDTGWMVLCIYDTAAGFVNVLADDCGDPHPYLGCPDGYKEAGNWQVGLQPACSATSGFGHDNGDVRAGKLVACVIETGSDCAELHVNFDDCKAKDHSCPPGWIPTGAWHTSPALCDGTTEGQGENLTVDSGWMTICIKAE